MRKHAAEQECIPIKGTLSSAQPYLKFRGSLCYNSGSTNETNQGQAVLQNWHEATTYMMIYVHIQAVAFAAIAKKSLQNGLPKSCWDSVLYDITS